MGGTLKWITAKSKKLLRIIRTTWSNSKEQSLKILAKAATKENISKQSKLK